MKITVRMADRGLMYLRMQDTQIEWDKFDLELGNNDRWKIGFTLPEQIGPAFRFMVAASRLGPNCHVTASLRAAHYRLLEALGWPSWRTVAFADGLSKALFDSIRDNPADLSSWHALADWLQENQYEEFGKRMIKWLFPGGKKCRSR